MEGELRPGEVLLEKYRVESVLGRGGMGTVLRVTHLHLGEELAIKVLSRDGTNNQEVSTRFLREARAVARLRGEHVARVSDVGVLPQGRPFMVMEYLRGIDLSGELARRGTLPPGEAVDYVLQACEALAEAHAHGIVHRDIKPANLFLTTRPDGTPLLKVLDFGISKAPITTVGLPTQTDIVMGTAGYMSPEQMKASRDVDARTDVWALGIVLYECLNGRRPFEGESFTAIVLMAGTEPPPPMDPRVPRALQAVVLRCLEK
ncbi:MAG TPA: serine/threonine-protein kinase, partial [Kofleriaceae bacterium]|nr:serine/threonine-protein kinase [Kofleriaceae bacterium]